MHRPFRLAAVTLYAAVYVACLRGLAFAEAVRTNSPSPAPSEAVQSKPADASPSKVEWFNSLDTGYERAQQTGYPILVFVSLSGQADSAAEWEALQKAALLHHKGKWTAVRLDADKAPDAIHSVGVLSAPALRLLSTAGRVGASKDGFVAAEDLARWLDDNFDRVSSAAGGRSASDAGVVDRAVADLSSSDPVARERAIRALISSPQSAERVVDVLVRGKLGARLAAVDLLEQWKAPTGSIDPWETSTLTAKRVEQLRAWAESAALSARSSTQPAVSTRAATIDPAELEALISAPTEIEARAIRERLVRFGPGLLPQVYARLAAASGDAARQRLSALRYRLVATESLAAEWPGGFDRLASADPAVRRSAASEFAARAKPEDHRLILELFGDADPILREQALRLLRSVGGEETSRSLMQLLADPEPNVRAAVLKTLAENPDESVTPDLVRYVASEQDADLLVHAVRVLQVTPGEPAFQCLLGLLGNPQWRVRGEAAEAMREKLDGQQQLGGDDRQSAIAALIKLMDDSDGYVVSRAVAALSRSNLSAASGPALNAVERHPELAGDVLRSFANDVETARTAMPQLLRMAKNPDARVRAAVVPIICRLVPRSSNQTLSAAFHDPDESVRAAGVRSMAEVLEAFFPSDGRVTRSSFFGLRQNTESVDVAKWVEDFRSGKERLGWMDGFVPDLQKALAGESGDTPVWAAVSLCALGHEKEALPVLNAAAARVGQEVEVAQALQWLPWESRLSLFTKLNASANSGRDRAILLEGFIKVPDERAVPVLWDLLAHDSDEALLEPVGSALRELMTGNRSYGGGDLPPEKLQPIVHAASDHGAHGNELQKTVALYLLLTTSPPDAIPVAQPISQDPKASPMLRLDAMQVLLWSLPDADATQLAIKSMADRNFREIAIPFLAVGKDYSREIHKVLYAYTGGRTVFSSSDDSGAEPIVKVTVPDGIPTQPLLDALAAGDPELAGYAGYLLAVMGDRRGYEPLLSIARTRRWNQDSWRKLVYRAITKMNDPAQMPVLEEIYKSFENQRYYVKDFYWTIRSMTGPQALAFRKRIRDEIGMEQLR